MAAASPRSGVKAWRPSKEDLTPAAAAPLDVEVAGAPSGVNAVLNAASQGARRFADADADGNQELTFEEFYDMQPEAMTEKFSKADFKVWFDAADLDGGGTLSVDEFFFWTLSNASRQHGDEAIEAVFAKYDKDKTGRLTALEFQKACEDCGFGLVASEIFRALDTEGDGEVSYRELRNVLQRGEIGLGKAGKQMVSSLVCSWDSETRAQSQNVFDSSRWVLNSDNVAGIRKEMQEQLAQSGAAVIDVIKVFDVDADRALLIDKMEFVRAMQTHFNYQGALDVLERLFSSLDLDASGKVGFDELYEFIRGKRHSLDARNMRVKEMTLDPPPDAGYTLEQVAWDSETLRYQILLMMDTYELGTVHLIRAWDQNGDRQLTEKEFCANLRNYFQGRGAALETLWKAEVEAVAKDTFQMIARKASDSKVYETQLDIVELEVWLRGGADDFAQFEQKLKPAVDAVETPPKEPTRKKGAKSGQSKLGHVSRKAAGEDDDVDEHGNPLTPVQAFEKRVKAQLPPRLHGRLLDPYATFQYSTWQQQQQGDTDPAGKHGGETDRAGVTAVGPILRDHAYFWNGARARDLRHAVKTKSRRHLLPSTKRAQPLTEGLPRSTPISSRMPALSSAYMCPPLIGSPPRVLVAAGGATPRRSRPMYSPVIS